MTECQFHNNCGVYCETPEQVAFNLCENCLDAKQMHEAVSLRTAAIVDAATELLDVLDAAANVDEPSPEQREWMERLRTALAA
ncbi:MULTISPECIES: hypothetical protein [Pseudomonas syringae group]|uniref:hypothetical protein n=1 Tax=Pseudomonas syringae group TaxID=136849 RepID=UPI000F0019D7|nr:MULTISPECIES: hypothetical protein [Pseudomonas syringae group]